MSNQYEEDFAQQVSKGINKMAFDEQAFCEAMGREHRTLQQSFTRVCFEWIKYNAKTTHMDMRNEAGVNMCKKIVETFEHQMNLPFI